MTAPLRDRLAKLLKDAEYRNPILSDAWFLDGVDAFLASEEWQAREAVVKALNRCESSRGAFSCCEPHDNRCPKSRAATASEWKGDWRCVCGREDLDTALARLRNNDAS